ncbi:MAG: regulatory protein RecX [Selenomonadaceae bacterium]|nr:regulatory protein RecX [Selenomonadaceae bacterium]
MKIKKTALMKATELLAYREHSEAELKRKLLARKYDSAEVDATIDKLKQHNYLDDAELCRQQFENFYAEGKLSVRQIVAKLIQRGFDKDFIEQLIPADSDEHELQAATLALTKKFKTVDDKNFRAKAWQFLSGRGFDSEIIFATLENFSDGS